MAITFTQLNTPFPGAIVVAPFRNEENNETKPRPVFVVAVEGNAILGRGIYTKPRRSRRPLSCTRQNGLDHDSFVGERLERIPLRSIYRFLGETDPYFDPFDDFLV